MNYAIIAAGEGSRLVREGVVLPKPLIKLNSIALIDRLIAVFCKNNAESLSIIVNEKMTEVRKHIESIRLSIPFNVVVKSTPSSLHSFFELSPFLKNDKFCLTTVDTIFKEDEFAVFIRAFENDTTADGFMAVTDYVEDEKPLYVSVDEQTGGINGFWDIPERKEKYVSGGIYCLKPPALKTLDNCMEKGMSKMRNYQRQLIADGLKLKAYPFSKIIDVDHAGDIEKAEKFLRNEGNEINEGNENNEEKKKLLSFLSFISFPSLIKIAGVRRGNLYSPNHIGNDAAIFNLTLDHLKKKINCNFVEYSEEEFRNAAIDADVIFNMVRGVKSIQKLQRLEDKGKKVINSGYGIENCTREKMTRLLLANQIPYPKSIIVPTNEPVSSDIKSLGSHCWIKRGDSHTIHWEDVTYARTGEEAETIIREYALRGIPSAVINEHLEGDLVKFYGIKGTDFFYWFYSNYLNQSKFGLEVINGKAKGIPFDLSILKENCNRAAQVLNICIYGGDCVVAKDGTVRIIDFNDWPSFAPCRNEAAPYIAECIYKQL
jgi:NDP-sugar pyrophosphorylase family protein